MLQSIKNTIGLLLLIVVLDNGATINIDGIINELNKLIDDRTDIEQLTFDELIDIINILLEYINNDA